MKSMCFLAFLSFPLIGISGTRVLHCDNNNIKIEFQKKAFSLKFKYSDTKRKAFTTFESGHHSFSYFEEGEFSSLELIIPADRDYSALFEDEVEMFESKPGTKGIPLFLKVEKRNGYEDQINVFCDVIK